MICASMETSKLTAEGIIGEVVRIGARMSGHASNASSMEMVTFPYSNAPLSVTSPMTV